MRSIESESPKGRRINNFAFLAEDFRRLPRSPDEGISGIFRVGATKAGGEKTDDIDIFIYRHLLTANPMKIGRAHV